MSNPTFGYLASLVSPKKTRVALHTAPTGKVVEGKISITHKDPYPIRVRIGVSSGGLTDFNPENYILFDYEIGEGQSYESDTIYYGGDQSLVVWASCDNASFVLHGQVQDDPTDTGFVAAALPTPRQNTAIYTVPTGEEALISLFVANQGPSPARFRVAISDEGAGTTITSDQYLEYNRDIVPRTSYQRTNLKIRGGQSVVVFTDTADVSFSVYAKFNYSVVSTDFTVAGQLDVGGSTLLRDALEVQGITTLKEPLNAEKALTLGTDAVPANLTVKGDIATGSGSVSIADSTGNISTSGVLTAGTIATTGNITAGSNKVVLNATTGDVTVTGILDPQGGFLGDLDLLNNKVTNLADPAAATDAANRKYVDSKVVAFSIALG
tara:strand:+ start:197 stop:1339 length:1143 start_codon:yes stop_codon:yes gene_type:complete